MKEVDAGLPGIEEFLHVGAPAAVASEVYEESYEEYEEQEELPPVEHFLDPLPPVSYFSDEFPTEAASEPPGGQMAGGAESSPPNEEGWLETAWQNYNWEAAGALGETGESEASSAWAQTDWDATGPRTNAFRPTAAQAIANALDQIAQQIRDGELVLPPPASGAVSDPSAIAATLASLLGIRQ